MEPRQLVADVDENDSDNDDWMNEDPNVLNNPELLYRECEKLPFPGDSKSKETWEIQKMVRELILDNNVIFDELSNHVEIRGSEVQALNVIISLMEALKMNVEKCSENCVELQNAEDAWDEENMQEIFSNQGSERILQWKSNLNEFLKCYSNIRKFIPKESQPSEQEQNAQNVEIEREQKQLGCLPDILEELEVLGGVLQNFLQI